VCDARVSERGAFDCIGMRVRWCREIGPRFSVRARAAISCWHSGSFARQAATCDRSGPWYVVLPAINSVAVDRSVVWCQDGMTALLFASAGGHLDVVQWLVRDAGSDARTERAHVRQRSF
jgi:hypothetical protein